MDSVQGDQAAIHRARRSALFRAARERIDPAPRPLGLKRSHLQARKHRQATLEWHVGLLRTTGSNGACMLISADGMTAFAVSWTATALVIERRHCPSEGRRASQVMLFESVAAFDRWCGIDPCRFDDPLLDDQLRRKGHELFAEHC